MRVLQVHNLYSSAQPSGENVTCALLADGLEALGHEVERFWPSSDDLAGCTKYLHAGGPLGISPTAAHLRATVRRSRADVALVHNVYPTMGPAAVRVLDRAGIPVVHVVHNYRHSCVASGHWRDGAECFRCLGGAGRLAGVARRCYRGSAVQSAVVTAGDVLLRRDWARVRVVVHLSEWMRRAVARLSPIPCPDQRVVHDPVAPVDVPVGPRRDFLYVGRLAEEKGVLLLLEAWRRTRSDWTLHIAGAGPLAAHVRAAAAAAPNVVDHGAVSPGEIARLRARTAVACVPALWDEPFGRVAAEAHAAGQPVLATGRGALPEIVVDGTGRILPPDVAAWTAAFDAVAAAGVDATASRAAQDNWRNRFSTDRSCAAYAAALAAAVDVAGMPGPVGTSRRRDE